MFLLLQLPTYKGLHTHRARARPGIPKPPPPVCVNPLKTLTPNPLPRRCWPFARSCRRRSRIRSAPTWRIVFVGLEQAKAIPEDLVGFSTWFRNVNWPSRAGPPLIRHILPRWGPFLEWRREQETKPSPVSKSNDREERIERQKARILARLTAESGKRRRKMIIVFDPETGVDVTGYDCPACFDVGCAWSCRSWFWDAGDLWAMVRIAPVRPARPLADGAVRSEAGRIGLNPPFPRKRSSADFGTSRFSRARFARRATGIGFGCALPESSERTAKNTLSCRCRRSEKNLPRPWVGFFSRSDGSSDRPRDRIPLFEPLFGTCRKRVLSDRRPWRSRSARH